MAEQAALVVAMIENNNQAFSAADLAPDRWAVIATLQPLSEGRDWLWCPDDTERVVIVGLIRTGRVITVQRREPDGSYSLLAKLSAAFVEPKPVVRRARVA